MSDTSLALRILTYAGHVRSTKTTHNVARPAQTAAANRKADTLAENAAWNVGWHSYEWWEHHNYEHR